MPNCIYGIIEINDSNGRGTMPRALVRNTQMHNIWEDRGVSGEGTYQRAPTERFGKPTSNTIPTIVRGGCIT